MSLILQSDNLLAVILGGLCLIALFGTGTTLIVMGLLFPTKESFNKIWTASGANGKTIARHYQWRFTPEPGKTKGLQAINYQISLEINAKRYKADKRKHRNLNIRQYHTYAQVRNPEIETLANEFKQFAQIHKHNRYHLACNVLAFVQQSITYARDVHPRTGKFHDYPKYPLETLVDSKGDCEDQAILAAAILTALDFETAVLIAPSHAALGLTGISGLKGTYIEQKRDKAIRPTQYYYAETTGQGWYPGQVPQKFQPLIDEDKFEALPV